MKTYSFKTTLTGGEKYKLSVLIMLMSGKMKKMLLIIMIPFLLVVVANTLANPEDHENPLLALIVPGIMLFILFVFPLLAFFNKNAPDYEFNDWGMILKNKDRSLNVRWEDLAEYIETGKYILIRQANHQMFSHILQKNNFSTHEELKDFIDILSLNQVKRKA